MTIPQKTRARQPRGRGSILRGGRKILGLKTVIEALERAIEHFSSPPDFQRDMGRHVQTWNDISGTKIPKPKIPKPYTSPGEPEKDIESLGDGGVTYQPPKDSELDTTGWGHLEWGDTGTGLGENTHSGNAPTSPPEYDVPQPEGIWIPPLLPERILINHNPDKKVKIYISVGVNACKGNSYSSPAFPDSKVMFFYFYLEDGGHLNDGWATDPTGQPRIWFEGRGHWMAFLKMAEKLFNEKLAVFFEKSAGDFYSPIRATYNRREDGSWDGPHRSNRSTSKAESGYNFYFYVEAELNPPPLRMSPIHKGKDVDCCNTLRRNQDRIIKDLKQIKKWTGADYDEIEMPAHPFMDTPVGWLGSVLGRDKKKLGSIPDLIVYFIQAVDTMFGDEFPMKIKVPEHLVEGAKKSGEEIPEEFEMVTPGEAIKVILEMVMNLQDDEGNSKALLMKCLIETYKAREEAYKARNILDQLLKWTGVDYEEVKNYLQAEFTLPETDNDPNNAISWEDWKEKYPGPDEELRAFLEPSKMAVKSIYFDVEKSTDLSEEFYYLRNIYSIVRVAHTIGVGTHRDGIKDKLASYLVDFGAKYAYHSVTAPKEREKRGIVPDEDDANYDPKGLKEFKRFRRVVEDGLVGSGESSSAFFETGATPSERRNMPYGRHPEESAEIRDVTEQ